MIVLGLLLGGMGSLCPAAGWAQEAPKSGGEPVEGYALHKPTKRLYYYRLEPDSSVYIRQGKTAASDSAVTVPAHTLASIFQRVEKHVLSPEWEGERLAIGYEDRYLVLQFSQRFDIYVLGVLVLVVVVGGSLLVWLWWRLSQEQRRRAALAESRRYLTEGREKERERLAREIHDGPVQDLHGLHMRLNALQASPVADQIQGIGKELMRVTSELRAMSADLHPPALHRFGLAAALRSHTDRLEERHPSLQVEMDLNGECEPFAEEYALPVFRIAQEALNNAAQHAQAQHAQVRLKCEADTVRLEVEDDGDGFVPPTNRQSLADQDHYGLLGMWERAEAIGAELEIDSTPGEGTCVRFYASAKREETDRNSPVPA